MSEVEMSEGIDVKSAVPALRSVVFQKIPETYQFDQPVTCTFKVDDSSFSPSAEDRIGLYEVGWRSLNDHVSFVNVKLPLEKGCGTVTFKDVPKDDEEFYQFCYVSSSSHIYGASSPFQFVSDDFEIIEDLPDASMLDCDSICRESNDGEEAVLDGNGSTKRHHTADSDLEEHLSILTEENKKLAEELSLLKAKLKNSQFLGEGEEEKCDGRLMMSNHTGSSQNNHKGGTGDAVTDATSSKDTLKNEKMLYSMETWFHNPYSQYIPANVTDFSSITVVASELWPKNETVPGNKQTS